MKELKKIKSNFVKKQAEQYLANTTLDDVLTNFIYNQDMDMFAFENNGEYDENDPFDYYEQADGENTELKQMVLNRIVELVKDKLSS